MDIALLSNFVASDGFIKELQKADKVSFTIVNPNEIENKFDIKTETFSLSGNVVLDKWKTVTSMYLLTQRVVTVFEAFTLKTAVNWDGKIEFCY